MKDLTFNEAAHRIAVEVAETVISKQHDYGPDNILRSPYGPEVGLVVRLWDKVARLKHLGGTGEAPKNESIDDTWTDIMGYALIGKMVRDGSFNLPLKKSSEQDR
jgi:hypothetical protein